MDREAFVAMLTQTCEDTSVWPMPNVARMAPDECRAMIDELCRAAGYYPQPAEAEDVDPADMNG